MKLVIRLPANRWLPGQAALIAGDGAELGSWPCRGKADDKLATLAGNAPSGNPSRRDPRKRNGDTPAGAWQNCRTVKRPSKLNDRIGAAWIPLPHECAADDATRDLLDPERDGHRDGLAIHAGRGDGELKATEGCVRMRDKDLAALLALVGEERFAVEIEEEEVVRSRAISPQPVA